MSVWAIMTIKDEADIIGFTLYHLIQQGMDGIIVSDNNSTDATRHIIYAVKDQYPDKIFALFDSEVGHYQSRKMTRFAKMAFERGASWIVPCDADELWYSWNGQRVADILRDCAADVVGVPMWNHFCTVKDAVSDNPFERMTWRKDERNPMDKVCYRYNPNWTIAEGNHSILNEYGGIVSGPGLPIGIRHFPYRSAEQFVRKARNGSRALAATNLPPYIGAHWRDYGRILEVGGEAALKGVFNEHFYFTDPERQGMLYDPAPFKVRATV